MATPKEETKVFDTSKLDIKFTPSSKIDQILKKRYSATATRINSVIDDSNYFNQKSDFTTISKFTQESMKSKKRQSEISKFVDQEAITPKETPKDGYE